MLARDANDEGALFVIPETTLESCWVCQDPAECNCPTHNEALR